VERTDSYDLAIPYEEKKIPEMVINFAKGPRENPSSRSVQFDQPLYLSYVIEFGFSDHPALYRDS
jgi:hypothetical protein